MLVVRDTPSGSAAERHSATCEQHPGNATAFTFVAGRPGPEEPHRKSLGQSQTLLQPDKPSAGLMWLRPGALLSCVTPFVGILPDGLPGGLGSRLSPATPSARIGEGHHVVSAPGAWMFVAPCAPPADDEARAELKEVLGVDPLEAAKFAAGLLTRPHPLVATARRCYPRRHPYPEGTRRGDGAHPGTHRAHPGSKSPEISFASW
jgi:hypothetical protein